MKNIWELSAQEKQEFYEELVKYSKNKIILNKTEGQLEIINEMIERKKGLQNLLDISIIKGAKIVGMTTNGCAKFISLVEAVAFQTVIIEEAAEVLESDIAIVLNKSNQHLILIGDEK